MKRILPDALNLCHDKENVLVVWWYNKRTREFLTDVKQRPHTNSGAFGSFDDKDIPEWVRGRVIKNEGKNYLVVYTVLGHTFRKLTEEQLNEIISLLYERFKLVVNATIDPEGYDLFEAKRLNNYNKIIAVDFDGTLCTHEYPSIGKSNKKVIENLIEEQIKGAKVILWTCRNGKELKEAIEWCLKQGIEFDAINDDLPEIKKSEFGKNKSIKIFANEYWDDKAVEIKESIEKAFIGLQ